MKLKKTKNNTNKSQRKPQNQKLFKQNPTGKKTLQNRRISNQTFTFYMQCI